MKRLIANAIDGMDTKTGFKIDVKPTPYLLVESLRQEIKDPPDRDWETLM